MQPSFRRIPGAHGLTLHLVEWPGAGPPLLFLHGFGMSARVWDPFARACAKGYRVFALDASGHGESDHDPEFRYSHAAVSKDVEAVADALALERLTLVGHSMGGYASIRYAARHPERVARLVLVDAGPELSLPDRPKGRRPRGEPKLSGVNTFESEAAYASALGVLFPRARTETLAELAHHWLRRRDDGRFEPRLDPTFLRPRGAGDPENRRSFDRARWVREESERLWRYLGRIACPTLVVRGAESSVLSEATLARMVDEVLADGRAVTIPGAGHALILDAPEAFAKALADFLP